MKGSADMEHFMTSEEIAELLHVDPVTIRRLVNKGELSAYRIGADYRFAPSDLAAYLQRQRIAAHAQNESGSNPSHPLNPFTQALRKVIQVKHTTPSELLNRFDRFTKRARHVLALAQEEAQRLQHSSIGTEHLLLGLLREGEGVAAQVLTNLGIEVDQVRHAVEAIVGRRERIVRGEMALCPRTKKVFELAVEEAQRLNHQFIGTEHLLLGLIREDEGIAAEVLKSFGLQLEQVRTETLRVLRQRQPGQEEVAAIPPVPSEAMTLLAEDEPGLACTSCGARCPGYFRYCFNCGQPLIHEEKSTHGEEE
jgi:excisionase family DNA binding protein